jgi:predicted site-specific integrase-resolvase
MFVPRILLGAREISQYLGISRTTLWRYQRDLDCPVTCRPDGQLVTSTTLLADWQASVGRARRRNRH